LEWLAACVRADARQIRGKFFRWLECAMDRNVARSLIGAVCTENLIRVDDVTESLKLAE
jgi:hypothetical protein